MRIAVSVAAVFLSTVSLAAADGEESFRTRCALCHGGDAAGSDRAASILPALHASGSDELARIIPAHLAGDHLDFAGWIAQADSLRDEYYADEPPIL